MEWAAQLDKALEEDRLILNCQRIDPIMNGQGALHSGAAPAEQSHYEILLTMQDELGDVMPPSEFILAAMCAGLPSRAFSASRSIRRRSSVCSVKGDCSRL